MPDEQFIPPTETLPQNQSSSPNGNSSASWGLFSNRSSSNNLTRPEKLQSPTFGFKQLGHILTVFWAIAAATATATNSSSAQYVERQTQSLLFRVRGAVAPPAEVVILAIDEESLSQLSNWPLRRATYAEAIDKVMQAGAKAVAVDVRWDLPSSYGSVDTSPQDCAVAEQQVSEDDRQLQTVLERYDGKVTLAVDYDNVEGRQWEQFKLALPYCPFRTSKASFGSIKFPIEANERIHRLGSAFGHSLSPQQAEIFQSAKVFSFAEAVLQAAGIRYSQPQGDSIFFYGGSSTFRHPDSSKPVPFWHVLSPDNWNSYLQNGKYFKDKIVLIGPTTPSIPDILNTPFGTMPGVELHANAIATLLEGRAIREALPQPFAAGGVVGLIVLASAALQTRTRHPINRLLTASAIAFGWGSLCYIVFTSGLLILPTAIPMSAIVLVGLSYLGTGIANDRLNSQRTRKAILRHSRSPLIKEIIDEQDDLKDLLRERELEIANKTLKKRYKIDKVLASGGFGETYIAKDLDRPNDPECVVKHLHPVSNNPSHLKLASRMFEREAEILERLGKKHEQIPRLLAYFEEDEEFYLVQEFIPGSPLSDEFFLSRQLPELRVVNVLKEILQILNFVHEEGVIHRDVKPSNIIKRRSDGKLVLIDFGAVKDRYNQLASEEAQTNFTVGIGTQGYMAPEQGAGKPQPNSDIYALGMMGIQALTGLPPSQFSEDPETKEIAWQEKAQASSGLKDILSKMTRYDFRKRYQAAIEVLQDLKKLSNLSTVAIEGFLPDLPEEELNTITRPWPETFASEELPPTQPPSTPETDL